MKKNNILKPVLLLAALFCFLAVNAGMAEAQRGQYHRGQQMMGQRYDQVPDNGSGYYGPNMMDQGYTQAPDSGSGYYGPGMMGRQGMMGPGMMGPGMTGPGLGMMPGMTVTDFLNLPGLTDKQREDIRTVEREARREHREALLDMMDARDDFADALAADRPDPERIAQLHEAMSQKQREMIKLSIETRNRIYDLLTEEQREQLQSYQRGSFEQPYRWPR